MTPTRITELALASGFKLKPQPDGTEALNPYVFDFAAALLSEDADLFWNNDDPETGYPSIDELLDSVWSDGVLEVGAEFTVQQAVSLPRVKVRVTAIDDESGLEYEIVQPSNPR